MSPSKIRLKIVTAKAELIREMLAAIETLPLASEAELSADVRMMAAGESFLRRSLEGLLDLGRHVLSKGFGKVVPDYAAERFMILRRLRSVRRRSSHQVEYRNYFVKS